MMYKFSTSMLSSATMTVISLRKDILQFEGLITCDSFTYSDSQCDASLANDVYFFAMFSSLM